MDRLSQVLRCSFCGAPLPQPSERVFRAHCPYCGVENRLVAAEVEASAQLVASMQRASEEGEEIGRRAELQRAELEALMIEAVKAGDGDAALRHFEGMLRMAYASTVHLYRTGMPPELGEPALQKIDANIREAVHTFATQNGYRIPA